MNRFNIQSALACIASTLVLQACSGGGGAVTPGVGGSYLHVSIPDFYFGTKDIGTTATQEIEIANRGGDIYPINKVTISGENSDEFSTDFLHEVMLQPAEAIRVRVTFQPVTDGRKHAALDVDFDTIVQVSDAANQNEQHFYEALELEKRQNYRASLESYSDYIEGGPVTKNKRHAAIKAPVIRESQIYGDGPDFNAYLDAVNARESGEYDRAIADVDSISVLHSDSYIADDAIYLKGYIQLMDKQDYSAAIGSMQQLRKQYPDSNYYDTALFSEALAQEKLGNRQLARSIYEDLRYRHTGIDTLGITLAKDNLVSRMWFERATDALESLNG